MIMTVKLIKLSNGDTVISSVKANENDNYITLNEPIKMIRISQQNPLSGKMYENVSFGPWEPMAKTQLFNIRKRDVLTISEPRPDMIKYYETLKLRLKEEIELDKQLTKQSEQALKEDIRQLPGTVDKQKISNLTRILEEIEHMKELEHEEEFNGEIPKRKKPTVH